MKKILTVSLLLCLAFSLMGCSNESANQEVPAETENLKVALCLTGPINDKDWNALAYDGLMLIGETYGVETNYSESISQSEMEEIIRNYALNGYQVIFGHGYEFIDAMMSVAAEFPEVHFIVTSADVTNGSNLCSLAVDNSQQGFISGAVAAIVSEKNHVVSIAGMDIPPMRMTLEGFALGAKYIDPDVKVETGYLGSFDDAGKLKEMMTSYLDGGADVGMLAADQAAMGGILAIKEKDAKCVGLNFDQSTLAPENVVLSVGQSYALAMDHVYQEIVKGDIQPKFYNTGLQEGTLFIIDNPDYELSDTDRKKIDDVLAGILDGTIRTME